MDITVKERATTTSQVNVEINSTYEALTTIINATRSTGDYIFMILISGAFINKINRYIQLLQITSFKS